MGRALIINLLFFYIIFYLIHYREEGIELVPRYGGAHCLLDFIDSGKVSCIEIEGLIGEHQLAQPCVLSDAFAYYIAAPNHCVDGLCNGRALDIEFVLDIFLIYGLAELQLIMNITYYPSLQPALVAIFIPTPRR